MLETLARGEIRAVVHRLANLKHVGAFIGKKKLTDRQVLRLVAVMGPRLNDDLLQAPFRRKKALRGNFGRPSRFSDGTWATFYAALSEQTAQREAAHHYAKAAADGTQDGEPVYYSRVRINFKGVTIDLRTMHATWPELLSDDYAFCQGLGGEAHKQALGGFIAPSARDHPGGSTVPAFRADTLSNVVVGQTVRLTFDAANSGAMVTPL